MKIKKYFESENHYISRLKEQGIKKPKGVDILPRNKVSTVRLYMEDIFSFEPDYDIICFFAYDKYYLTILTQELKDFEKVEDEILQEFSDYTPLTGKTLCRLAG